MVAPSLAQKHRERAGAIAAAWISDAPSNRDYEIVSLSGGHKSFTNGSSTAGSLRRMRKTLLALLAGMTGLAISLTPALAKPPGTLTARVWASGKTLTHTTSAGQVALSGPDDLTHLGAHVFVAFQNGVGSKGEASPTGNTDSTIVEFSKSGKAIKQWDVTGKVDGMGAAPSLNAVLASVNEDGNSSLYELRAGTATHYSYSPSKLPSGGGTDAITAVGKLLLVSASAPSSAKGPAVYKLTSLRSNRVAKLAPLFADDGKATSLNAPKKGKKVRLALTDPDSSAFVPTSVSGIGGDFVLDSQGDQQLIFVSHPGTKKQSLTVLNLSQSVDDLAWATSVKGTILTTDASADAIISITGRFSPGTAYTAVTPCNANSAPTTCTAANYFGTINSKSGAVTAKATGGVAFQPKGMVYLP